MTNTPSPTRSQIRIRARRSRRVRIVALSVIAGLAAAAGIAVAPALAATPSNGIFADTLMPRTAVDPDRAAVELGVRFSPDKTGTVTALQYYQGQKTTGVRTATLWSAQGAVLARATFEPSSRVGWRTVPLASPVTVTAGDTYVASYQAPNGGYPVTERDLTTKRTQNGFTLDAGAGVYRYGATGKVPFRTFRGSNYLVDIVFAPSGTGNAGEKPNTHHRPGTNRPDAVTPTPTATATPKPTPTATVAPKPTPTATVAPQPSAPPTGGIGNGQKNCINTPSSCGYPDETNTGVPQGTTLTRVPEDATSGPGWTWRSDIRAIQTTSDGAKLQNLRIGDGMIIVQNRSVTLRNTYIASKAYYPVDCDYAGPTRDAHSCLGLTVENVEISGTPDCQQGLSFNDYTARRVYVHGCLDGFKADSGVLIEDSYVTALAVIPGSHNDGVQSTAAGDVTVRRSTFKLGNQTGVNSVFQMGTKSDGGKDVTIEGNLIDGGAWMLNSTPISDILVKDNRFTRRAVYGIGYVSGGTWVGNFWDDTLGLIPENN